MKKIFKILPLLFVPFMMTSCTVFDYGSNPDDSTPYIYPTSISITGDSSIFIGETKQLSISFQPEGSSPRVLWSSSDSSIIEAYAGGAIKGKGIGTATIYATATGSDGNSVTGSISISCSAPAVSGISFAKDHKDIKYNTTYQLEPIVSPEFALDKSVNYVSSNPSIASVNSTTGLVTSYSTTGSTVITATTNEGGFSAEFTINVKEHTGTTLMVYMCGTDLESGPETYVDGTPTGNLLGLASTDLQEMTMAAGQPEDVNIVIETGGASNWRNAQIRNDELGLWEIRDQQLKKKSSKANASMGESNTLKEFITWGVSNYPADHYGLLLWNHGGAMSGICFDELHGGDSLKANELRDAVANAQSELGYTSKFEFIAYDACLMAIQDVAELNSHYFNYMLSSQESESGTGYDYDAFLPDLYDEPGMDGGVLLEKIATTFLTEQQRFSKHTNQTQSVYDLSKMAAYKSAFETFSADMAHLVIGTTASPAQIRELLSNAKQYGYTEGATINNGYQYYIYDIESTLSLMKADSRYAPVHTDIDTVLTKLEDVVIFEAHGDGTTGCGMNLYCPLTGTYDSYQSNFINWKDIAYDIAHL